MVFMGLKVFSKGAPLHSLVHPELCTRQHMSSAREKSLEILRHGPKLNASDRADCGNRPVFHCA